MSEKKYPTRMHEVLGVEPNELFVIKGSEGQFYLNDSGDFRFVRDLDKRITDNVNPYSITKAINHGIIRHPRLTEEHWISVKDRLPEPWVTVMLWDGDEMVSGYMDDDGNLRDHRWRLVFRATHWMLPEPPGEEGRK